MTSRPIPNSKLIRWIALLPLTLATVVAVQMVSGSASALLLQRVVTAVPSPGAFVFETGGPFWIIKMVSGLFMGAAGFLGALLAWRFTPRPK
ncbi:MAG: hypothetical protein AAF752_12700 [Bacteroidota bacterium]